MLSPITAAAAAMSTCYEDIMAYATQAADAYEEEHTGFVMQVGLLMLQFFTNEELIPVSWELVYDFARAMKLLSEKGLVGGCEAILKSGAGEIWVQVGMVAWAPVAGAA